MAAPPTLRARLVVLAVSALVFGAGGIAFQRWYSGREVESVELVDNTAELTTLLEERAATTPPAAPSSEPSALVIEMLDPDAVKEFYPTLKKGWEYDPDLWIRRHTDQDQVLAFQEHPDGEYRFRTNSLGMRMDSEPLAEQPDLRVLVLGDSHTACVCSNPESFAALLGDALRARDPGRTVEVLNAGVGGYNFYNYVVALRHYRYLDPDVLVLVPYGGNDFHATAQLARYFQRLGAPRTGPAGKRLRSSGRRRAGTIAQELSQTAYFLDNPEDEALAAETADAITVEIERLCSEDGIALVTAFLPTASLVQPEHYERALVRSMRLAEIPADARRVSDRLGESWMESLRARGRAPIDLHAVLAGGEENYWQTDFHLNVRGQRLVAEALLPAVVAAAAESTDPSDLSDLSESGD